MLGRRGGCRPGVRGGGRDADGSRGRRVSGCPFRARPPAAPGCSQLATTPVPRPAIGVVGGVGNRLSHVVTNAMLGPCSAPPTRASREELGLTGRARPPHPSIIYGFSPRVVPVASDAQTRRVATGYWTSQEPGEQVDPVLREFVERPGAVVSIGFGSMRTQDPATLRAVVERGGGGCRRAGGPAQRVGSADGGCVHLGACLRRRVRAARVAVLPSRGDRAPRRCRDDRRGAAWQGFRRSSCRSAPISRSGHRAP